MIGDINFFILFKSNIQLRIQAYYKRELISNYLRSIFKLIFFKDFIEIKL